MFTGFTDETVDFMWGIRFNNERTWFEAHKDIYLTKFYRPMKELGDEIYDFLQEERPDYGLIRKVTRIYRDARRLHGRGPYKDHLWFSVEQPSEQWTAHPTFWFELAPEGWTYGMGYYLPKPLTMAKLRARIDRDPKTMETLTRRLARQKEFQLETEDYKRPRSAAPSKLLEPWYRTKSFSICHEDKLTDEVFSRVPATFKLAAVAAVVSIVIMAVLVLAVGRAFCGWVCPVPLLDRVRGFFRSPKKRTALEQAKRSEMLGIAKSELGEAAASPERAKRVEGSPTAADGAYSHDCGSCSSCKGVRAKLDSRHYVLGGALLSTAIFGFPVFCLVCPIGLTFATVLVVWRLFAAGDMTWSVVLIPLLLVVELVFLRKWCTRFCPMAGLMNLVSRFSKTWRPVIDESKCLETVNGAACSKCAIACEADINLRHPDFGERTLADCTRCRACVDACPAKAVSMPFLVKKGAGPQASTVVLADIDEKTAE